MAHYFRTTHNPIPSRGGGGGGFPGSGPRPLPYLNPYHHHHPHPHFQQYPPPPQQQHHHYQIQNQPRAQPSHSIGGDSSSKNKSVRFDDDFRPSALQIKIKLGPRSHPTSEVKISVYFEVGKLPRIKVKTKRPREQAHRQRKRTYVEEQDGSGRQW